MSEKLKTVVNPDAIRDIMDEYDIAYGEIADLAEGRITFQGIWYLVTKGRDPRLSSLDAITDALASAIGCEREELAEFVN